MSAPTNPSDRLNGWKEIASFLGKGVRTVQRWEKELGLPVRRLGKDGGEIIFAFKSEIQAWSLASARTPDGAKVLADAETATDDQAHGVETSRVTAIPVSVRLWTVAAAILSIVALAGVVAVSGLWRPGGGDGEVAALEPQPAEWSVEADRLRIFDTSRTILWSHHFEQGVDESVYRDPQSPSVFIDDVDGDERNEVLFQARGLPSTHRALYLLNSDGTTRFTHLPAPTVKFGDQTYAPHWQIFGAHLTRESGATSIWAAFIHDHEFPTLLQQLDPRANVRSEYWSNGYVEHVSAGTWRGQPVVLVGATNNEHKAASLAVFRGTGVKGSAPAVNPEYKCQDCPAGRPDAFIVFPRICMVRTHEGQPYVYRAWVDGQNRLMVIVSHGVGTVAGRRLPAHAFYALRPDLTLDSIELSREFFLVHQALEREGALDHAWNDEDERDLQPVLRWDGDRFVELPKAPVRY